MDDFAESLAQADEVVVTGIYKSREEPIPGVAASTIVERIAKRGHGGARYVENVDRVAGEVTGTLRDGDAVVVMGAGDVGKICTTILERLAHA
jgi:UDP-N-acetylmuramate--alanine ligase